ncbi:MAG: hypothetical protein M3680_06785 [Myxococcota bacterium]|nr:hypothetical protein [Myxococcota bacterium]
MRSSVWLVVVMACGTSGGGSAPTTWTVGGIEVPSTVIPLKLEAPTRLPVKLGGVVTQGQRFEMDIAVPDKLNIQYVTGEPPLDDRVVGFRVMIYGDPVPALTAKWGEPEHRERSGDLDAFECWTATERKLEACVTKHSGQQHWGIAWKTTEQLAPTVATVAAAPEPAPAATYVDYPPGVGPCAVVGIGEVSAILGAQMQYVAPEPDNIACSLSPAIGAGAARDARQVTAAEAAAQIPDLTVAVRRPADAAWTEYPIEGLGERAVWDGDRVQMLVNGTVYRVSVIDRDKSIQTIKERTLAIARKVAVRAAAAAPR